MPTNIKVGVSGSTTSLNSKQPFTIINVLENRQGGTGNSERRRITSDTNNNLYSQTISSNSTNSVSPSLGGVYTLPLPKNINIKYNQDWGGDDTSSLQQMISKGVGGDLTSMSEMGQALKELGINIAVGRASHSMFKKAMNDKGLAYNPLKELFYNGVNFRSFSFEWEITPTTKAEASAAEELIYRLAYHSSPDITSNMSLSGSSTSGGSTSAFIIPDTFEIEFVNTRIPKMKSLAVTDFSTNYTAAGAPKILPDGTMGFITINLDVIETSLITKQEVNRLYGR